MRYGGNGRHYTLTDGAEDYTFHSKEPLAQGNAVVVEGEIEGSRLRPASIVVLSGDEAKKTHEMVKTNVEASANFPSSPALVDDEMTAKLWPVMKKAALEFVCAKKLGRSVLLRFHGDADGISGAFALTNVLRCRAYQQNSAVYSVRDALKDIGTIGQENGPLVVLLDFGSNDASSEGLGLLKAAGIQFMVIDHHPPGSKAPASLLSPFLFSDGTSDYTAGYLACEIAVACGMDAGQGLELAKTACAGDKSELIPNGKEERKKAMVLDFLAAHTSFGNNLGFYKKVMGKEELFSSIAQQADESIGEAARRAMTRAKRTKTEKLEVVTFPLDAVVKKGGWPPSSKITTCIYEKLSGEKALLCIGHTERSVIIRLNDAAAEAGLSANELAKGIVKSMADFVEGGGGHVKAGAIRVKSGFAKDVVAELTRQAMGE
jgi:RecJ-like exonuclease